MVGAPCYQEIGAGGGGGGAKFYDTGKGQCVTLKTSVYLSMSPKKQYLTLP